MVVRTTEQVNRTITLYDNKGLSPVPNTSYLLHDLLSELLIP